MSIRTSTPFMLANVKWHTLIQVRSPQHIILICVNLGIGHQCYGQLTVLKRLSSGQCHMTVSQAEVYNSWKQETELWITASFLSTWFFTTTLHRGNHWHNKKSRNMSHPPQYKKEKNNQNQNKTKTIEDQTRIKSQKRKMAINLIMPSSISSMSNTRIQRSSVQEHTCWHA